MRRRWDRIGALVSVLAVVLGLTACSTSGESNELLIYNAQHESLTKAWIDAFTKETGIKVTYRQGGDTELGNQLVAEGAASPADVFLTENSPAMAAVERAGLFADLNGDTVDQVPTQYRPATGKWTGVAARSTLFVYNTTKLTSSRNPCWTSPSLRGRGVGVALRPRRTSRPSSARCFSSRASRLPRNGWPA
jgi:iron(III) transport system substrate-binding protein